MTSRELHNKAMGQRITIVGESAELLELNAVWEKPRGRPPLHYHPRQAEHFEVLEGRLRVQLDGEERVLSAGDSIDVPAGAHHEMTAADEDGARAKWEVRPALRTAQMMEALFSLERPSPLQAAPILRAHSDEFRLAKPPWPLQRVVFTLLTPLARLLGHSYRPGT